MWLLLALIAPLVVGGILGSLIRKYCKTTGQKLLATGALIVVVVGAVGLGVFLILFSATSKSSEMMEIDDERWFNAEKVVSANFSEAMPLHGACPKLSSLDFDQQVRSKQCSIIFVCGSGNSYLFVGWKIRNRARQAGTNIAGAVQDISGRLDALQGADRTFFAHGECFDPVAYYHGSGPNFGGQQTAKIVLAPVSQAIKKSPPEFTMSDSQNGVKLRVEGRTIEDYGNLDTSNLPDHETITCSKKEMVCHRTVTTAPMKTEDMTGVLVNGDDLVAVPIGVDASTLKALEGSVTSNYQIASWSDLGPGYQIEAKESVGCRNVKLTINSFERTVTDSTVQSCDKNLPSEYNGFLLDGKYNMTSEAKQQLQDEPAASLAPPASSPTGAGTSVSLAPVRKQTEASTYSTPKPPNPGGALDEITPSRAAAPSLSGNWHGKYTRDTNQITKVNLRVIEDRTNVLTGKLKFDSAGNTSASCAISGIYNSQDKFMLLILDNCLGRPPADLQGKIGFSSVDPTARQVFGVDSLHNSLLSISRQ
jgi:hypothetical protein